MNLPVPCSQSVGSRSGDAVKEPDVYVCGEYITEGCISQTCDRTAVTQKLPDFLPLWELPQTLKRPHYSICTFIVRKSFSFWFARRLHSDSIPWTWDGFDNKHPARDTSVHGPYSR
jgi:hypothetical protein